MYLNRFMETTKQHITDNTAEAERVYALQSPDANLQRVKETSVRNRINKIRKIEDYLTDEQHQQEWLDALWKDLHKCKEEAITTELTPILTCMKHIYDELHQWVKDQPVDEPWSMAGMKSYIKYEPKGHVMVISPWNYPLQLALNPVIHAIAAGNVILLKPSEIAIYTSHFLKKMIDELFEEDDIAVVEGGIPETTALLNKPFNHIFFTGSPAVGKIVMKAASQHLTSVTLELGGKSPVVIDESVNIDKAAGKVAFGKCMNAGQTCIAPDYVIIHKEEEQAFAKAFGEHVQAFYNPDGKGVQTSEEYGRIIDDKNFKRIKELLDDAVQKGAHIALEGEMDESDKFISPYVLTNVNHEMEVMQEEIFGPILPVLTYNAIEEVPGLIKKLEKPLALYILSKNKKNTDYIIENTSAGGTAVNELMVTSVNPYLPFGGSNFSGIGKSNGKFSFIEFSNERGVVKRRWGSFKIIYPPYNKRIVRWLSKIAKL